MNTPLEIERRFLVHDPSKVIGDSTGRPVRQGYLAVESARSARVRRIGSDCFLTVKSGAGLVRQEVEIPLTPEHFEQLWPLTEGRRIEKTRHAIPWGGFTIEVDTFDGTLAPLCIAEIEFASVEESELFVPPAGWFGEEITSRRDYSNASLALHGLPPTG